MKRSLILTMMAFFLLGCAASSFFQATPTPTPLPALTATVPPTITPVPTATLVAAADLEAVDLSALPAHPEGYTWKILPEKGLAVLIPDGWFFKEETREELNMDGVYVTKENIDEVGRFSTGLSILVFKGFGNNEEAEQYEQDLLAYQASVDTTKEILDAWDYQSGDYTFHHLRIRAEYPHETEVNRNKIVHYSSLVAFNSVYWMVFESPESIWEETLQDYGVVLDYIVILGD